MTNREIANVFSQIANILELGNEKDRFRIIAYERAADTIAGYSDEMSEVYKKGGLQALNEVPDIGESIAEKIEELLKTGHLKYLKEIQKNIPSSELEFMDIPGIGPKTAAKISKKLKAKSIKDLKTKIEKGKANELFEEKTRQNILRGIEIRSHLSGRILISDALLIAEEYVALIRKIAGVKKTDYVGSLRRMRETIGDIDIVAATKNPQKVIEAFIKFPGVEKIITQGAAKSTIIHRAGCQVDLEIVPEEEYGSLLQHFTGSKEHNVALRTYAQEHKMSVSEHGIKKSNRLYRFRDEKSFYRFLGMDEILPELRENMGEIEAALKHQLPKSLELKDIRGDLHVHSNWSDGKMTIEQIAQEAEKLSYEYICISDHTVGLGIAHGLNEKALQARQKEIEVAQKKHPKIKLLSSVEVNILANGDLDIKDWMLEKLDIVTASVHSSFHQDKATITKRIVGAINHPHVDIIGHPSGRLIGQREAYDVEWDEVFRAARKNKTVLEISASPYRLDLRDALCREAKKYGVKFAINTDTHNVNNLSLMRFGVSVARRGWLEKKDIINTLNYKDLVEWAKRKN